MLRQTSNAEAKDAVGIYQHTNAWCMDQKKKHATRQSNVCWLVDKSKVLKQTLEAREVVMHRILTRNHDSSEPEHCCNVPCRN
eukprot:180367-Pelagomonas_calceolata.AAC.6